MKKIFASICLFLLLLSGNALSDDLVFDQIFMTDMSIDPSQLTHLYVNHDTGDDSHECKSNSKCKTIMAAVRKAPSLVKGRDAGIYIHIEAGRYPEQIELIGFPLSIGTRISFLGDKDSTGEPTSIIDAEGMRDGFVLVNGVQGYFKDLKVINVKEGGSGIASDVFCFVYTKNVWVSRATGAKNVSLIKTSNGKHLSQHDHIDCADAGGGDSSIGIEAISNSFMHIGYPGDNAGTDGTTVTNCAQGILFQDASTGYVAQSTITNNTDGIILKNGAASTIGHNAFSGNSHSDIYSMYNSEAYIASGNTPNPPHIEYKHGISYDVNGVVSGDVAGPQGPQGETGATGPQGPQGATGPQGPAGANGKTVLNGAGTPDNATGSDGDFYIDTTANMLYGPKVSGAWPTSGVKLEGLWTKGTDAIYTNSKVGIGTSSPNNSFEIVGDGISPAAYLSAYGGAANLAGFFSGTAARGTKSAPTALRIGDAMAIFAGGGYDGTTMESSKAYIALRTAENWASDRKGTRIIFYTTPVNAVDPQANMTLSDAGFLGVGVVSPQQKVEINGGLRLKTSATKPDCSSANPSARGTFWFTQDDTNGDRAEVCARTGGAYAWKALY